jgi:hypothetical protein
VIVALHNRSCFVNSIEVAEYKNPRALIGSVGSKLGVSLMLFSEGVYQEEILGSFILKPPIYRCVT